MAYHVVVGIEMHCEMKSITKVFSPGANAFDKKANVNVNEIDLGFPGVLPNVNKECVNKAIMAALILNCKVPNYLLFDRKNYYYPDLPKGYQITQNTCPIGTNGHITILVGGKEKDVKISDIHLEEDTASLDHLDTISLIDYNRAGVGLLECVTEPCLYSADEAVAFIDAMCKIYRYTDISEADTKRGQIRCDVNVNLMDENGNYVTPKVEIKNVNSLSNVKDAIIYEENRQKACLENGETLMQETRRFDEMSGKTVHMRSKVDAIDYKYFVEPNIPPYVIDDKLINIIKEQIPMLALERYKMYMNNYNLDSASASIIVKDKNIADYFESCLKLDIEPKIACNWLLGSITSYINKEDISILDFYLKPEYLKQIIDAQNKGVISSKQAKEVFNNSLNQRQEPNNFISKENSQISDEALLEEIIDKILLSNQRQVAEYHNGKTNMFDYFVGQVMKETKGKASPVLTKDILNKKLN